MLTVPFLDVLLLEELKGLQYSVYRQVIMNLVGTGEIKIVNIITKDRAIDKSLRNQIERRSIYTCELHYCEDQLIRNAVKTTRKPGALPSINLPVKRFSSTAVALLLTVYKKGCHIHPQLGAASSSCYLSFNEFCTRIIFPQASKRLG